MRGLLVIQVLGYCLLNTNMALAQEVGNSAEYSHTITPSDLYKHLSILASDGYEGRETARAGQKKAAKYIKNHFSDLGLKPYAEDGTYLQSFPVRVTHPEGVSVKVAGNELELFTDYYNYFNGNNGTYSADEILYLGYGIKEGTYNDYGKTNVKDRIVIVSHGEPKYKGGYWISGGDNPTSWTYDWRKKVEEAEKQGAKALIVIDPSLKRSVGQRKPAMVREQFQLVNEGIEQPGIPVIYMSRAEADRLLVRAGYKKSTSWLEKKIGKKKKPINVNLKVSVEININRKTENLTSENVLGYLEGTDKKEEVVVISAHYDHLGKKGDDIYNGADDDGSGTVSLLEVAEAFAIARDSGHAPRRSILFLSVSGEEKGLYGSEYYTDNPTVLLKNTVADLNIDMVGRTDIDHKDDSMYVYVIGADKLSMDLHRINEKMNSTHTNLNLDYKYNNENDPNRFYYRSDHYNFAKNGIPVIFYFTGVHKDYHKPTDTVDKIMFGKTSTIAQLVFHTAWELVNRETRIVVDKK